MIPAIQKCEMKADIAAVCAVVSGCGVGSDRQTVIFNPAVAVDKDKQHPVGDSGESMLNNVLLQEQHQKTFQHRSSQDIQRLRPLARHCPVIG